ncbi:glucose 1-dehydrogenase [Lentilactobacillus diolivorans]|jgi:3alpha(or 20beta)-hydroxysteroid dehydrogenase|uniref:glucose 1-dehydrogenase n=1 Tax=Lentilactobacillus diolivorans TaxID=179838 RepID=UPI000FF06A12|nr:glucose 1-dehydrogenase [Lentilactobacillus diolivorans]MDH5106656.1 glucose 1-dehydrogenase [Lentilactobacillus diolivorans]RRG04346.1 MAG: SDR family NAD(P)-dependent oxidoreductase [Lactobacillus sp.]
MANRLKDKVAIITGGVSGIGLGIAECYIREGAKVVLTARKSIDKGKEAVDRFGADKALFVQQDVSQESDWEKVIKAAQDKFGKIDIVVNNAGVPPVNVPIDQLKIEDWNRIIAVNLTGTFLGIKHGMLAMKQTGGGSIINISSIEAFVGVPTGSPYNASKGGVRAMTKAAALDATTGDYHIRVNSVHPGFIDTPILPRESVKQLASITPMKHIGKPKDIGELCIYLGSEESEFATGSEFVVDGGFIAQ